MVKIKVPKKFILMLGDVVDRIQTMDSEKIKTFVGLLNNKSFRVADTTLSYRQINSLDSNNILNQERISKKNWRRFSLKELIYLALIKELRIYGFLDKQFINLREAFFSKDLSISSDFALMTVLGGVKVILVIDNKMDVCFYSIPMLGLATSKTKSFININLNEIVMSLWDDIRHRRADYQDELQLIADIMKDRSLSDQELQMLKIIRDKNYKTITIRKKNNDKMIIKAEKIDLADWKKLKEIIRNKDFIDISIAKRDGKIVNVKVEDSFKI